MEPYFEKLLETRGALECALAYLAAEKAVSGDGDKLRQPLSYAIARDVDYHLERDFDFHLAIADIADNDYLRRSLQSVMVQITEYLSRNRALLPEVDDQSASQHWNIMVAILANEPDRAEQTMRSHMQYVTRLYSRELNRGHL